MRVAPPDLPGAQTTDSPIDRALALLLADETEAALRWAAAAVERAPSTPSALVITCRLLEQMGRPEAAVEGFELSVRRAIDGANLPLAVAAIGDLRALGVDVRSHLDALASAFCLGSDRCTETEAPPPPLPNFEGFQPLSSFLTGPALTSKATQIIHDGQARLRRRGRLRRSCSPLRCRCSARCPRRRCAISSAPSR